MTDPKMTLDTRRLKFYPMYYVLVSLRHKHHPTVLFRPNIFS